MPRTLTLLCIRGAGSDDHGWWPSGAAATEVLSDGVVLAFDSAVDAVAAARQVLRDAPSQPGDRAQGLGIRVGLDVGDTDASEPHRSAAFGRAAALADRAAAGEALVGESVRLVLDPVHTEALVPLLDGDGAHRLAIADHTAPVLDVPRELTASVSGPWVDRPEVWDALVEAWTAARDGEMRAVVVGGPAGVGKSRLLARFAETAAADGALVLYGRSNQSIEPAFGPYVEALEPLVDALAPGALDAILSEQARHDLSRLLRTPATSAVSAAGTVDGADGTLATGRIDVGMGLDSIDFGGAGIPGERHWAFEAVVDLLTGVARSDPVLLLLDDLHWAGLPTMRLTEHVLGSDRLTNVCVVATHRSDAVDRTSVVDEVLDALARRRPGIARADLADFDLDGVRRFVVAASTSGEDLPEALAPVADHLFERCGGNAFLLSESWRHLRDAGRVERSDGGWMVGRLDIGSPRTVRDSIDRRLAVLPATCRSVLETAACAGDVFDATLVARASDHDVGVTLDLLARAVDAGLLRPGDPGRFRFVHSLVREAIEERLAVSERCRRHQAIGRVLATSRTPDHAALAHHFAMAVPIERSATAVAHARAAADQLLRAVSYDQAVDALRCVLPVAGDDLERADVLTDLALASARSGATHEAADAAIEAAAAARRNDDGERLACAALALAEATRRGALHGAPAVALLREALHVATDPVSRCELLGGLVAALAMSGRDAESREVAGSAVRLAEEIGDPRLLMATIHNQLYISITPEHIDAQLELAMQGLDLARRQGNEYAELSLLCKVELRLCVVCDPDLFRTIKQRMDELARRLREPYYLLAKAAADVALAIAEARFADAETAVDELVRWAGINDSGDGGYGTLMFAIRREQGRLAEIQPVLEVAARSGNDVTAWQPGLIAAYAEVGMIDRAAELLDGLVDDGAPSLPDDSTIAGVLALLADAAHLCGHTGMASHLLPQLERFTGRMLFVPGSVCFGSADRYIGRMLDVLGHHRRARDHLQLALEADVRTGWECWIAHSRLALGHHLIGTGRRVDRERGLELLASAREMAGRTGMVSVFDRCDAAIGVAEAAAASAARDVAGLTPREWDVLRLVAEGRTNREIGAALHTSHNTVANQMRSILAKTECANRTEAAAWLHDSH